MQGGVHALPALHPSRHSGAPLELSAYLCFCLCASQAYGACRMDSLSSPNCNPVSTMVHRLRSQLIDIITSTLAGT
eukprot:scaffold181780_cov17-Tisochrysis_lutea.AAC.1